VHLSTDCIDTHTHTHVGIWAARVYTYIHTQAHTADDVCPRASLSLLAHVCVSVFNHLDDLHVEFRASWPRRFHAGRSRVLFVQLHLAYPRVKKKKKKKKNGRISLWICSFFFSYYLLCAIGYSRVFQQFNGWPSSGEWQTASLGGQRAIILKAEEPVFFDTSFFLRLKTSLTHHLFLFHLLVVHGHHKRGRPTRVFSLDRRLFRPPKGLRRETRWTSDDSLLIFPILCTVNSWRFSFFLPVAIKWMLLLLLLP
jgi:hypothetical protein